MRFIDMNPHGGIGANCSVCEVNGFRFAIDSGLHPKFAGKDAIPAINEIDRNSLDFIVLTHCHLDHLGSLPLLSREHPDAPVLMSYPSSILARRMLSNSISVMKRQRNELNLTELPLYGRSDLSSLYDRMKTLAIKKPFTIEKDGRYIDVILHHAGHVAGAVSVEIKSPKERILFTGDILFDDQRTLDGAQPLLERVDTLVTETTRGMYERNSAKKRESEITNLLSQTNSTIQSGGSVLIPVFALGRMQELLSVIEEAIKKKILPKVPIFCSGLGMDLVNHFHEISKNTNRVRFNRKILRNIGVQPLPKKLEPGQEPPIKGIFLVSSGMLVENTPSYVIASSILGSEKNSIFFVGYCDPSTPGGELLSCKSKETFEFTAYNHVETVNAKIEKFDLSGHADREEIVSYAEKLMPKNIFLHHGDADARKWFEESLRKTNAKIIDPKPLEIYET